VGLGGFLGIQGTGTTRRITHTVIIDLIQSIKKENIYLIPNPPNPEGKILPQNSQKIPYSAVIGIF
jgi:hypothetical protein